MGRVCMRTVEAVEGELELGRVRFWEGDVEAVERGVRRAEDGEQGLEEDAALQRRGRRRRSRGVEVVVVEEVAREGDRTVRRPRAVERVQLQLMKRQRRERVRIRWGKTPCGGREATRGESNLGGERLEDELGCDAREEGDAPAESPQRAAAHRQLHGRIAAAASACSPAAAACSALVGERGGKRNGTGREGKVAWAVFAF